MEDSQKKSVESVLEDLQHLIRSPLFQKDQAIDYLVNLKIVAKETKHAKAGFYSAVLTAMQNKMWASKAVRVWGVVGVDDPPPSCVATHG